jgi:hypothetical protein
MERFIPDARLPTPNLQATNILRLIGDHFAKTGAPYPCDPWVDPARVGALDLHTLQPLLNELVSKGLISNKFAQIELHKPPRGKFRCVAYGLTLDGWERYEAERRGLVAGKYGFIAMQFNDDALETFVRDHVKPVVKREINYDVIDVRDRSQAGIIDNIMRAHIRDAAFVLADLTHDNSGAYWEAGYAEGLGKPVIYLCRRAKFDQAKTHFDTNHCTTVLWSADEPDEFGKELVATLRHSLNLFPTR